MISSRSVVFRRFFSVVYLDTPGERFSEAEADRHSVHSRVITIRTPLFLAIKDVAPQKRSVVTNNDFTSSADSTNSFDDCAELRRIDIRLKR